MSWGIFKNCERPVLTQDGRVFACGSCPMCRKMQAAEWSLRGRHELIAARGKGTFMSITYGPEWLPKDAECTVKMSKNDRLGTLRREDFTKFVKRIRKRFGNGLRIIGCGEYGPKNWRPHYHLVIFGRDWNEWGELNVDRIFREIWGKGKVFVTKKPMSPYGIDYTVGYVRKKIGSRFGGKAFYEGNGRERTFLTTSKGIGREWCIQNAGKWARAGKIPVNGKEAAIPRAYIKCIRKAEGVTIKLKLRGEERTRYKVLENPEGELSVKIRETLTRIEFERIARECSTAEKEYIKKHKNQKESLTKICETWEKTKTEEGWKSLRAEWVASIKEYRRKKVKESGERRGAEWTFDRIGQIEALEQEYIKMLRKEEMSEETIKEFTWMRRSAGETAKMLRTVTDSKRRNIEQDEYVQEVVEEERKKGARRKALGERPPVDWEGDFKRFREEHRGDLFREEREVPEFIQKIFDSIPIGTEKEEVLVWV